MILFHATFGPWVDSILEKGLIPRFHEVWEDCDNGVFLASDPHEAESYCECTENEDIPDDWLDDIWVFAIDTDKLNRNLLEQDPHVKWDENPLEYTIWIYRGVIPLSAIVNIKSIKGGVSATDEFPTEEFGKVLGQNHVSPTKWYPIL